MKKATRILCLLLAALMLVGIVACTPKKEDEPKPVEKTYDEISAEIYDAQLGEFKAAYAKAKEATNISERFALMAIAEAKLLESGVMLPLTTRGGNYAISRVAPYTVCPTLWGNDSDRFHNAVIADKLLLATERAELKAKYTELKGTGTYEAFVKDYLKGKGYAIKDTYTLTYSSDPKTWDALATSRAADSNAIVNIYDGLYEYDIEGVQQPALATGYTVSEDGLTYTFTIREGVKWVDSQGREIADVTAGDFVAGMQHMMDAKGGLEYLVEGVIVNASEYIAGTETDFTKVGVSATDDHTLVYTLTAPCSYFMTMLGYNCFAPLCKSYYESKGGAFGADFDSAAETYTYGIDKDSVAYCGPYLVTNATEKNTIVFAANPAYWNKDNINIKTLTWLFNDGTDTTKAYNDALSGVIDGAGLNASTLELAKKDGNFDKYVYVSNTDATSFMAFTNINRAVYANVNNEAQGVSAQTQEQRVATKAAMQNQHFRLALAFAVDRATFNAQDVGDELKLNSLRNSYTPGTFVTLAEEVTVDINGTAKTYAAGTVYGQIMQDQIDADGFKFKAFDPAADDGVGSTDGFDGWYNAANAVEQLNIAVEELKAQGVTIDAEHPIHIDYPVYTGSTTYQNRGAAYKQSVEAALGGLVIVNVVDCPTSDEWYYAGYYTDYGYEANYDIYDVSGWGPDYGDPATYLDTFLDGGAGYMVKCIGIF